MQPKVLCTSVVLLVCTTFAAGQECTLQCEQNAPCSFTTAEDEMAFQDSPVDRTVDGMHCRCPHGWTGVRCEVPFETCDGNHPCLNGGSCVPGLVGPFGNEQLFCNCKNAADSQGRKYVGKFCEQVQSDEELCDDMGSFFCVNGGNCNSQFPAAGEPCMCPPEYFGEHCEYERGSVPEIDCNLPCGNGGKCMLGEIPYDQLDNSVLKYTPQDDNEIDHMHCSCPEGYDGEYCEYRRTPCGESYCFHGGLCVTREVDGETIHHCDCGASTEIDAYAGRFCQYKATSYCTRDPNLNSHLFCVNGGHCRENPKDGCDCDDSIYAGFSCEFVKAQFAAGPPDAGDDELSEPAEFISDPEESYICNLNCQNDGVCRNGLKDLGYLGDLQINAPHLNMTHDDFMHCVCPDGFTGVLCEELIQQCGEGEHLCLHGSTCVKDGDAHGCDCSTTTSEVAESFEGDHCEHPVNDFCTTEDPLPGQPRLFCVNGGTCAEKVPPGSLQPKCNCREGFYGPHCELAGNGSVHAPGSAHDPPPRQPSATSNPSGTESKSGLTPFGLFLACLSVIMCACVSAFSVCGYWRKRKQHDDDRLTDNLRWASTYRDEPDNERNIAPRRLSSHPDDTDNAAYSSSTDPFATHLAPKQVEEKRDDKPQLYIGPPRDEDGHELHNVEIL